MSDQVRRLYDFELEPEVRDWLDSLSDSDFRRVDEVCGLLAEKGSELGGPWSDHLEGPVRELRIRLRDVAARITYWCTATALNNLELWLVVSGFWLMVTK